MSDEMIASDIVEHNTKAYAKHVLSNMFPNVIDGMKRVRRRILYTQPTDETFSGLQLISNTIRIHPFGDSSIFDAACRMTDSFRNTFPLLALIGKGGSYGGDRAASARYIKFKMTDFCKDIFFNGVNFKTIPMELTEDMTGREIQYFIPKIPTALLIENESVGFGYSSHTVPMKFENICDLVIDFINCKDRYHWNYHRLAKLFVPCLPIRVDLKNEPELISAYSKGDFDQPIETEGKYTILSNNSVLFRTFAYGVSPGAIRGNLTNALRDKNHWLSKIDATLDALSEDTNYIDFRITVKRGVNVFELIENIKGILRIRTPMYVINNFVFNDKLVPTNPPGIINMWYKERYRSIFGSKKHKQQELQLLRMRLETYLIVCEHVNEVIDIIRKEQASIDDVHNALKERFGLSTRQCQILLESNLQILMRSKRTELEERLAKVADDLNNINTSFKNIDSEICTEVKQLKKKYKTDTTFTSAESQFNGCLLIGDLGILQVNNASEVVYTGKMFSGVDMRFIPYHTGVKSIKFAKLQTSYNRIQALPASTNATGINVQYKQRTHLFIRTNKKSTCIADSAFITSAKAIVNHVSTTPFVITNTGKLTQSTEDLFDTRKHSASILYAFDEEADVTDYVVISVNAAHPNVVRLQPITLHKTKVLLSGAGETSIVNVIPKGVDSVIVNLPSFHRYSMLHVTDISKYLKGKMNDVNIRNFDKL